MRDLRNSKNIPRSLAVLACLLTGNAHAYTECYGLSLIKVFTDDGGNLFVSTGDYLKGYVPPTSAHYKTAVAIAIAARVSGALITIRYERDGVTCGSAAWNEPISVSVCDDACTGRSRVPAVRPLYLTRSAS